MGGLQLFDLLTHSYCLNVCLDFIKLVIKKLFIDFV